MININNYISEKLHISKDYKSNDAPDAPVINKLIQFDAEKKKNNPTVYRIIDYIDITSKNNSSIITFIDNSYAPEGVKQYYIDYLEEHKKKNFKYLMYLKYKEEEFTPYYTFAYWQPEKISFVD